MEIADRDVQLMLIELGEDLGTTGPNHKGDDGDWRQQSEDALRNTLARLQAKFPFPPPLDRLDEPVADEASDITDLSGLSTVHPGMLQKSNVRAFVWHHTAGRGDAKSVINVLNTRGLNVQFIIDRSGKMFAASGHLELCFHAGKADRSPWDVKLDGSHANTVTMGCEVIANNNADVLKVQVQRAIAFAKELHNEFPDIFHIGHGELSSKKEPDEGSKIATAIRGSDFKIKPELLDF